jgi:hypothetical protein
MDTECYVRRFATAGKVVLVLYKYGSVKYMRDTGINTGIDSLYTGWR